MSNNILVRIDFQNDFVHPFGALTINAPELIERHQKFADNLSNHCFDKIIDTYDTHFAETYSHTLESQSYPLHCIFSSWGWQQAAPFKPELEVLKLYKSANNMWNEVKNYQILAEDWHGKNVYLCGVLSDVCVKQAMDGFLKRKAHVIIFDDLCLGLNQQISDILGQDCYQPFIEQGQLKCITSAQFFRKRLNCKKIEYNLVQKN